MSFLFANKKISNINIIIKIERMHRDKIWLFYFYCKGKNFQLEEYNPKLKE